MDKRDCEEFWDCDPDDEIGDDELENEIGDNIDAVNDETFGNTDVWNEDEHEELIARDSILSNKSKNKNKHTTNNGTNLKGNSSNSAQQKFRPPQEYAFLARTVNSSSSSTNRQETISDLYAKRQHEESIWGRDSGHEDYKITGRNNDAQRLQANFQNMKINNNHVDPAIVAALPQDVVERELMNRRIAEQVIQTQLLLQQRQELQQQQLLSEHHMQALQRQIIQQIQQEALEKQKQERILQIRIQQQLQQQALQHQQQQQAIQHQQQLQRNALHQEQLFVNHIQQRQNSFIPQPESSVHLSSIPQQPKILTVEELERQLLADREPQPPKEPEQPSQPRQKILQPQSFNQPQQKKQQHTSPPRQLHQQKEQDQPQKQHHKQNLKPNLHNDHSSGYQKPSRLDERSKSAWNQSNNERNVDRRKLASSSSMGNNRNYNETFGYEYTKNENKHKLIIPPQVQMNVFDKLRRLHSTTAMHENECVQDRLPSQDGFLFRTHNKRLKEKHDGILSDKELTWLRKCQQKIQEEYDNNIDQDYYYLVHLAQQSKSADEDSQNWFSSVAAADRRFVPRERLLYNSTS